MRIVSVAFACVLSTYLGGCALFADPNAWPQKFQYGESENLAAGPNIRFVNERWREMPGRPPLNTMCTEPSPDAAVAFGTTLGAQATINNQGSGGFNAGTSEAALELAGRTAGVLALRDGLYATCQAYSNGALGQSAYALGLSQYGNLLVALSSNGSLGQGAPGGPGGPNNQINVQGPPAPQQQQQTPAPNPKPSGGNTTLEHAAPHHASAGRPAAKDKASAFDATVPAGNHAAIKDKASALDYAATHFASLGDLANYATDAVSGTARPPAKTDAARTAATDAAPGGGAPGGGAPDKPAPKATPPVGGQPNVQVTVQPAATPKPAATKTPAAANNGSNPNINPQVYTATESAATALLVACISEYDPTRLGAHYLDRNGNEYVATNGVLTLAFCQQYIAQLGKKLMQSKMR